MSLLRTVRLLLAAPVVALIVAANDARADEVYVSSFAGGVVTGTVNAELIVDVHCTIASGALINGNIKQPTPQANWNITIKSGADINGNVIDDGGGSVHVVVGAGQFFDNNITERGLGSVIVHVFGGGLFDGNIEENDRGSVNIRVNAGGLFNGNAYERHAGDMKTMGGGAYNGSTKEEGPGICTNSIVNFNGSPCE